MPFPFWKRPDSQRGEENQRGYLKQFLSDVSQFLVKDGNAKWYFYDLGEVSGTQFTMYLPLLDPDQVGNIREYEKSSLSVLLMNAPFGDVQSLLSGGATQLYPCKDTRYIDVKIKQSGIVLKIPESIDMGPYRVEANRTRQIPTYVQYGDFICSGTYYTYLLHKKNRFGR